MQGKLEGLYIVATPIGNYEDITLRAINILRSVDFIICEDTRVTNRLLTHLNIKKSMFCYNDHSSEKNRMSIIAKLNNGISAAFVSDAGTPLISDPGYKLVRQLKDLNIKVTTLPGPSAIITALTVAALPTDRFLFAGFLPSKHKARLSTLNEIKTINASLIFFESAKRLIDSLHDMLAILGNRQISILRELTKTYEEHKHGTIDEILKAYGEHPTIKGEIVIVTAPPIILDIRDAQDIDDKEFTTLLANYSVKDTAQKLSEYYPHCTKKDIYHKALVLCGKKGNSKEV